MKYIIYLFILSLSCEELKAQDDSLNYTIPSALVVPQNVINNNCSFCSVETYYPIGWSKDGNYAYATEPPDQACGCYYFQLIVRDLKHDTILWHYYYVSDPTGRRLGQQGKHKVYRNLQQLWKGEYDYFRKKLNEFDIVQTSQAGLLPLPVVMRNDTVKLSLKQAFMSAARSEFGFKYVDSVQIIGSDSSYSAKISTTEFGQLPPVTAVIFGYYKSPFENRIAILLMYKSNGFDGPPDILTFRPLGFFIKV